MFVDIYIYIYHKALAILNFIPSTAWQPDNNMEITTRMECFPGVIPGGQRLRSPALNSEGPLEVCFTLTPRHPKFFGP